MNKKWNEMTEMQKVATVLSDNGYEPNIELDVHGNEVLRVQDTYGHHLTLWADNEDRTVDFEDENSIIEVIELDENKIMSAFHRWGMNIF